MAGRGGWSVGAWALVCVGLAQAPAWAVLPEAQAQGAQAEARGAWAAAAEAWRQRRAQGGLSRVEALEALVAQGRALAKAGAPLEARALLRQVPPSAGSAWHQAQWALAQLERQQGQEALAAEAGEAAWPGLPPGEAEACRLLAADARFAAAQYEVAMRHYRALAMVPGPWAETAHFAWGWALIRMDQPEAAVGVWRQALARHPHSIHAKSARLALGNLALARGDAQGAAESFAAAAAGDSAILARAEFLAAEAKADAGDWAEALKRYQAVPSDAHLAEAASYGAAFALWRSGQLDAARARFDAWLALHPQGSLRPAVHLALGAIAEGQGDLAEAEAAYARAEAVAPTTSWAEEAWYRRARLAYWSHRPEEAEAMARKGLQRFPQGPWWVLSAHLRALALMELERPAEAGRAWAELSRAGSSALAPLGEGEVPFRLGMAHWHAGELAEAARALNKVSQGPRLAEARFWEAEARYRLGQHGEARRRYQEAAAMGGPRAPQATYGEAWALLRLGELAEAKHSFEVAAKRLPAGPMRLDARRQLAWLHMEARDWAAARQALADWLADGPGGEGGTEARYLQALAAYRAGELGEADQAFGAFLKAHPDLPLSAEAALWWGRTRQRQQRPAEAIAPLELAWKHPAATEALRWEALEALAAAYHGAGQLDAAQQALDRLRQQRDLAPERQAQARQGLIQLLVQQGQGARALELLLEPGQGSPSEAVLEELLELFAKTGEDRLSVQAYGALAKPRPRASYLVAQALLRQGDVARVQSLVEELKPKAPPELIRPLQGLLAKALAGQNKLGEAREAYLNLAAMGGGPGPVAEATLEAAKLAVRAQDPVAAERLLRQVAGQGQAPPERRREAWMALGDLQRAGDKPGLALVSYRQAKAVAPAGSQGQALAAHWAATMLVDLKQAPEALRELRSVRAPGAGAEALAALMRLKEGECLERMARWKEAVAAYEGMPASAPSEARQEAATRLQWIRRNVPEGDRR